MTITPNIPKHKLPTPVEAVSKPDQLMPLIERGLALHQQGKFTEAQAIYEEILAIQANHFGALQLLGTLFVQTRQFAKAVDFLTRALQLNPNHAASYHNRGIVFKELKRLDQALENYDKAINLKPDYTEAHFNRGIVLQVLQRLDEALESYDKAINFKPDYAEAYYNRGNTLHELKRLDQALESFDKAIAIKPDFKKAYNKRTITLAHINMANFDRKSFSSDFSAPKVHVITYNNIGNFGDRLGYHLLNDILPAQCQVSWGTLKPFTPVPKDVDLLIVGIGNSLFGGLLDQNLLNAVKSAKASIGIFGTQYREKLPTENLSELLDHLTWWYARYEEDILFYGNDRSNISHLGDWLINAFPISSGAEDQILTIGDEILQELPLDRTIQKIQRYRSVVSTRLHPLLCAFTSADVVSYVEQREGGNDNAIQSGKFKSLLLDVFGEVYPEGAPWKVNRTKVMQYKQKVRSNTDLMRKHIQELLK